MSTSAEYPADQTTDDFYRPTQDERTLACISHLTVFVSSVGFLVAVGLWIYLHTRRNQPYAAFQAGQAVIFQLLVMVLTFIVIGVVMLFVFGAFGLTLAATSTSGGSEVVFGIAMSIAILFFVLGIMLITISFYIYAVYAAVRSYQVRPFRIPVVASLAEMISPMPDVRGEHRQ